MGKIKRGYHYLTTHPMWAAVFAALIVAGILGILDRWFAVWTTLDDGAAHLWHWATAVIPVSRYQCIVWFILGYLTLALIATIKRWKNTAPAPALTLPSLTDQEQQILFFIASYDLRPVFFGDISLQFGLTATLTAMALNNLRPYITRVSRGAYPDMTGDRFVVLTEAGIEYCRQHERLAGMAQAKPFPKPWDSPAA
jgi:hypothetical protein